MESSSAQQLALGFDCSTQSLKITAVDSGSLEVVYYDFIEYDKDLPHYKTTGGVIYG